MYILVRKIPLLFLFNFLQLKTLSIKVLQLLFFFTFPKCCCISAICSGINHSEFFSIFISNLLPSFFDKPIPQSFSDCKIFSCNFFFARLIIVLNSLTSLTPLSYLDYVTTDKSTKALL